ncbi:sodium-dependent proline transporter-like [Lineus longissimus]|uniref:sodium-dependent proline transporter-like n=1 Tax=Lineus longissimus TaxID=88925 RepID=UPI002B4EF8FE
MEVANFEDSDPFFDKAKWNLVQFGLICTYSVGLDGIRRFPYRIYEHTGLFLVAYYLLLVVICIPVVYVQMKVGAVVREGVLGIFNHYVPLLKGVAVAMLLTSFFISVYENVFAGYSLYYMFAALKQPYIWETAVNSSHPLYRIRKLPHADIYFTDNFLHRSASVGELGSIPWYLALSLLGAWILTCLLVFKGAKFFGTVCYVTGPLVMLLMFCVMIYGYAAIPDSAYAVGAIFDRGNAAKKLLAYRTAAVRSVESRITSKMSLGNSLVWIHGMFQHITCIGLWAGVLPTLGSHVSEKKATTHISWILLLSLHGVLPHLCTITLAPYIYGLARSRGLPLSDVFKKDDQLLFITMPDAFSTLRVSPVIACIFFLFVMIFILHKQAIVLLAIQEALVSLRPSFLKNVFRRYELMSVALCGLGFFVGLPYVTEAGYHYYKLFESYMYRLFYLIIALSLPPFIIGYLKLDSYIVPIERLSISIWYGLAGLATTCILIFKFIVYPVAEESSDHRWAGMLGWFIAVLPMMACFVGGAVHALRSEEGSLWERFIESIKPRENGENIVTLTTNFCDANGSIATSALDDTTGVKILRQVERHREVVVPTNEKCEIVPL